MVLSQRVLIHLSGGHHGHTLFVTKRSRSRCDVFGFSANNNWILISRQSRPQAQQKKRIQHEYDRDSGAPPSRQRETWSSRTRLFFNDEHLKMTVSQREMDHGETHQQYGQVRRRKHDRTDVFTQPVALRA